MSTSPRERILNAALALLESGGVEAVSTRAVSAAAGVQPPTIYRQFGDMQGLLSAVASAGFAAYFELKISREPLSDPVEEQRQGWNAHVMFGLNHPHLYTLMYSTPQPAVQAPAAREAAAVLRALLQRVAEAGRLAVSVDRAAALLQAAAVGVTLTLLRTPVEARDTGLSDLMREAVLSAVLTPQPGIASSSAQQQVAVHAVALAALLPGIAAPFTSAEQTLLLDWLSRLTESER